MYIRNPYCNYWCPYLSDGSIQESQCMSKPEMHDIARKSEVTETYYIAFNTPFNKALDGVYHIVGVAGDLENFILIINNSNGIRLQFNSNQICALQLKVHKVPIEVPLEPSDKDISQLSGNNCFYKGKEYPSGSSVVMGNVIQMCVNGKWC